MIKRNIIEYSKQAIHHPQYFTLQCCGSRLTVFLVWARFFVKVCMASQKLEKISNKSVTQLLIQYPLSMSHNLTQMPRIQVNDFENSQVSQSFPS